MNMIKATKVKDMSFYERDNGSYQSKVTINGKRKTFYGKTKNEVRQKYQQFLRQIENDENRLCADRVILNDYIEYWLLTYKFKTIEPPSYDKLESVYLHQIHNTIGYRKMCEITTKDIQDLINNYASPTDTTKPLAKSGLKRLKQLINQCYEKAIQEKRLTFNPCKDVYIPNDVFIDVDTKQQFTLDQKQMSELKKISLMKNKNDTYKYRDGLVIMIMLNTGLRSGEMLALEWSDVDLINKTLTVNKIIQSKIVDRTDQNKKRVDRLKHGSKTTCGIRIVPLNNNTIFYFQEIQKNNKLLGIMSNYVCCTRTGSRQTHRNLSRSLQTIKNHSSEIPTELTLHTLRHTFGSTLIKNKVDVSVVSTLMGHANIMVTYNKYIHVINEEKAKAMDLVEIA